MEYENIIIGAGITGLTAALELQRLNKNFLVLEANDYIGGRAKTSITASGIRYNEGCNWLHGEKNPLFKLVKKLKVPYTVDDGKKLLTYSDEGKIDLNITELTQDKMNKFRAFLVKYHILSDRPVYELYDDPEIRHYIKWFISLWMAIDPEIASAREFLTDKSSPDGPIIMMSDLIDKMLSEICDKVVINSKVVEIDSRDSNSVVKLENGKQYIAKNIIYTTSLGVLKAGHVKFLPVLSNKFQTLLEGKEVARSARVIFEINKNFLNTEEYKNFGVDMLSDKTPLFCHFRTEGNPIITVMFGDKMAEAIEKLPHAELKEIIFKELDKIDEIKGYRDNIKDIVFVSSWNNSTNFLGAYVSHKINGKPCGPVKEGNIIFAGDAFGFHYSGSMAGAYLSGKKAAKMVG